MLTSSNFRANSSHIFTIHVSADRRLVGAFVNSTNDVWMAGARRGPKGAPRTAFTRGERLRIMKFNSRFVAMDHLGPLPLYLHRAACPLAMPVAPTRTPHRQYIFSPRILPSYVFREVSPCHRHLNVKKWSHECCKTLSCSTNEQIWRNSCCRNEYPRRTCETMGNYGNGTLDATSTSVCRQGWLPVLTLAEVFF